MNFIEQINTWLRERAMRARLRTPPHKTPFIARVPYPPRDVLDFFAGYVSRSGPGVDMSPSPGHIEPAAPSSTSLADFGEQLGEQLALAKKIADTAAQSDIECNCTFDRVGRFTWYDTLQIDELTDRAAIDDSVRYLELRSRLVRHPVQKHLVRFPR